LPYPPTLSPVFAPRLATPALAVLLTAGLCACDASSPAAMPPSKPPVASATASFGGTDLAWIEINIAMNDELRPLLDLVPAHSRDTAVQALAAQVKTMSDGELATLRALHDEARLPAENPHEGMPMPGMLTADLVAKAAATQGPAFDKRFRADLRAHLEQGVHLAISEGKAGVEPRSKALATAMIADRQAFLTALGNAPSGT
jgi:uncharacterized protein (DUF305 family)